MEEPKTAFAAFFQMRGRNSTTEAEFVNDTSYGLRWFSPRDAARLLRIGIDRGLLQRNAENMIAAFDVTAVTVPPNYRPGPEILGSPEPEDLFSLLLARVAASTGLTRQAIVASVTQAQERLGVYAEVAGAHVARTYDVDVSDILSELEAQVLRRSG